MVRGIRN